MLLSPGAERRSNTERRSGVERRAGAARRAASQGGTDSRRLPSHGFSTETDRAARQPEPLPLGRVLPHARFNESEAAERTAAIAAHQHELSARLERNVGLSVAALDRRSEEHTSELQSHSDLVCRLLLEKKNRCYEPTPRTKWSRLRPHLAAAAEATAAISIW